MPQAKANAQARAKMPTGTSRFLDRRVLGSAHRRLAGVLEPGMAVLDVGCGTGAITRGIAEAVGPSGQVLGLDQSPELINHARANHGEVPGLRFEVGNIQTFATEERFDLASAARLLQWLLDPLVALRRMAETVKPGGCVVVLDYNHEKIVWEPDPRASMRVFYDAFLAWRADAGFDNEIADRLEDLFAEAGLVDVKGSDQHEVAVRGEPGFESALDLWAQVAATRGHQLVADGYLTEEQRAAAERDHAAWARKQATRQVLNLRAAEGTVCR